ncbi:MAG TPA: hypothetical protein VMW79_01650 [Anaerolineae bacterium]|nr:hypothetical protein [Anaerolineae bacterium]
MELDPATLGVIITAVIGGIGGTLGVKKYRNGHSEAPGSESHKKVCAEHAKMHDKMIAGESRFDRIDEKLDEQKELSKEHSEALGQTSLSIARIATTLDLMRKGQ